MRPAASRATRPNRQGRTGHGRPPLSFAPARRRPGAPCGRSRRLYPLHVVDAGSDRAGLGARLSREGGGRAASRPPISLSLLWPHRCMVSTASAIWARASQTSVGSLRFAGRDRASVHGRSHSGPEASVRAWQSDRRSRLDHHPAPLGLETGPSPAGRGRAESVHPLHHKPATHRRASAPAGNHQMRVAD